MIDRMRSRYLHQLPSFDSIRSNTKDDLRKVNSPGKAKFRVKSHNMNKVIIAAQRVHLKHEQNLKRRLKKTGSHCQYGVNFTQFTPTNLRPSTLRAEITCQGQGHFDKS